MRAEYDISVLISTYNRADQIPEVLDSLLAQEAPGLSYEVVVVDNNSRDRTREVVEGYARRHPHVRYVFEGRQGIPHGRNAGIVAARSDVLAFIDDDVRAAPDWLARIAAALREHPDAGWVGGKILPEWPSEPPRWLTQRHWAPLALTDHGEAPFYTSGDNPCCLINCNLAVRRGVFERVGLYSPDMWLGEDRELQLRAWQAGIRGLYVPEIRVFARIQPERLTKAYHRKWYVKQGEASAKMRLLESCDAQGRYVPGAVPAGVKLFGVSGFVYREALTYARRWLLALLRRDEEAAFINRNYLTRFVTYIRFRLRHRAQGYAGPSSAPETLGPRAA